MSSRTTAVGRGAVTEAARLETDPNAVLNQGDSCGSMDDATKIGRRQVLTFKGETHRQNHQTCKTKEQCRTAISLPTVARLKTDASKHNAWIVL